MVRLLMWRRKDDMVGLYLSSEDEESAVQLETCLSLLLCSTNSGVIAVE